MYHIEISVKKSEIEGKGVFAVEDIKKGTITWKFDSKSDQVMSDEEFNSLDENKRKELLRVAYFSPTTKRWVYPTSTDLASFTNHSRENNQTVCFDNLISDEPFFRANRDIKAGEELTVNYGEFDSRPSDLLEKWI